jgi:ABC-2 type transport system permease protein
MSGFFAVLKRELFAFFVTPLIWVLLALFLLILGLQFSLLVAQFADTPASLLDSSPLQAFFGDTVFVYVTLFLLVPPLTMRLFAEERRSGTIETLLTTRIGATAVVLAKFVAALTVYGFLWAPTVLYAVVLSKSGSVDWGALGASYGGLMAVGASYVAVGLFASSTTKSQFVALALTSLLLFGSFLLGMGEFVAREGSTLHAVASHVSVWAQMNEFSRGIVDVRRLCLDLSVTMVFLLATVRVVESWHEDES